MTRSEFIAGQTDEELVAFVKTGRPASHPLNTTGIDMPPRGGNPALTDADIYDIVAYIHSIQK
jgi:disulfide bond formation protein DsbB